MYDHAFSFTRSRSTESLPSPYVDACIEEDGEDAGGEVRIVRLEIEEEEETKEGLYLHDEEERRDGREDQRHVARYNRRWTQGRMHR